MIGYACLPLRFYARKVANYGVTVNFKLVVFQDNSLSNFTIQPLTAGCTRRRSDPAMAGMVVPGGRKCAYRHRPEPLSGSRSPETSAATDSGIRSERMYTQPYILKCPGISIVFNTSACLANLSRCIHTPAQNPNDFRLKVGSVRAGRLSLFL